MLLIDPGKPEEILWLRQITHWFYDWWIYTRSGVAGKGLMKGNTIREAWSKILATMYNVTGAQLGHHVSALSDQLAKGHEAQKIDMVGTRATKKAAPITLAIMTAFQEVGWGSVLDYVPEHHRVQLAANLKTTSDIAYEFGLRGANLMLTDPRYPFHPNWNLSRGHCKFYFQDGEEGPPTPPTFLRIQAEGGNVSLPYLPDKGDPLAQKYGNHTRNFRVRPAEDRPVSPIEAGNCIIDNEIDYPCSEEDREHTPLLIDPRDGQWLRKPAFMKPFYLLLQKVSLLTFKVTLTLPVLAIGFGFHSYRAGYENAHNEAGTDPRMIELGAGWTANSEARVGYRRQQTLKQLAAQDAMKLANVTAVLPPALGKLQAALHRQDSTRPDQESQAAELVPSDPSVTHDIDDVDTDGDSPLRREPQEALPQPPKARQRSLKNQVDSLMALFTDTEEERDLPSHQQLLEGARQIEQDILEESEDTTLPPPIPSGWKDAVILLTSADTTIPYRARAATERCREPEKAQVVALEWDSEEGDYVAKLHYLNPDNTEDEGVYVERILFTHLKLFKTVQEETDEAPMLRAEQEEDDQPSILYRGQDPTLTRWARDNTIIEFDQSNPKRDKFKKIKPSWERYSQTDTINRAIRAGATSSDLAYDLKSHRVKEVKTTAQPRYQRG